MKSRDIVIGLVVLVALAGFFYFRQRNSNNEPIQVPETQSVEESLEEKFKREIPDDASKTELKDVEGGNGSGIATHSFSNSKFNSTILTDLPELTGGAFYQAWLVKDNTPISLGKLRAEKGGYMVEYQSNRDLSDYSTIWITRENKFDNTPETKVLEGSF